MFLHEQSCEDLGIYYISIVGTFLFFLFSFLCAHKKQENAKQTIFIQLEVFMRAYLLGFGLWRVFVIFVRAKSFCKKKKKFKTALITSFTLLLENSLIEEYSPYLSLWLSKFFVKLCGIVGRKFCNDQSFSLTTIQTKNLDKFTQRRLWWTNCGDTFVNRRLNQELSQGIFSKLGRGITYNTLIILQPCLKRKDTQGSRLVASGIASLKKVLLFWRRTLVEYFPETAINSVVS